jgi:hypothetical protein
MIHHTNGKIFRSGRFKIHVIRVSPESVGDGEHCCSVMREYMPLYHSPMILYCQVHYRLWSIGFTEVNTRVRCRLRKCLMNVCIREWGVFKWGKLREYILPHTVYHLHLLKWGNTHQYYPHTLTHTHTHTHTHIYIYIYNIVSASL